MSPQKSQSESVYIHRYSWNQEQQTQDSQDQDERPYPLKPFFIRDFGNAQHADQYRGCGCDHIGKSVSELVGHDGRLP